MHINELFLQSRTKSARGDYEGAKTHTKYIVGLLTCAITLYFATNWFVGAAMIAVLTRDY